MTQQLREMDSEDISRTAWDMGTHLTAAVLEWGDSIHIFIAREITHHSALFEIQEKNFSDFNVSPLNEN